MPGTSLLCYTPTSSTIFRRPSNSNEFHIYSPTTRKFKFNTLKCKSSSSSLVTDFDLYDLLGIDSSSDHSQIKLAYRSLQKRCHPDIAGPAGHDMAIILNDAYSILSDPNLRHAYDKEHAKIEDFKGFTGKPIYSTWFGTESEERAVFVDEVKCVGCLKCALFAEKTFAIESVYGRARVVAQWADPEDRIQDAIQSCPVDCISMVERSDLAALEFLMSKQPRATVRMSTGNSVGARVSNIFVDIKKFQSRFDEAKHKASDKVSQESDLQREARITAFQAIRSISNWLYWQSPKTQTNTPGLRQTLMLIAGKTTQPDTNKLRDAAEARRKARDYASPTIKTRTNLRVNDDYWTPSPLILPTSSTSDTASESKAESSSVNADQSKATEELNDHTVSRKIRHRPRNPIKLAFPIGTAAIASIVIRLRVGESSIGSVDEHMGGSMILDVVNSSWLQVILAGVTWYLIGMAIVELVDIARGNKGSS
ncbi:hypothetical protein MKW92_004029 [Papaver armeniacum]|nr:hypothetical protein MKW92_004029 [Papaver armeniacum]